LANQVTVILELDVGFLDSDNHLLFQKSTMLCELYSVESPEQRFRISLSAKWSWCLFTFPAYGRNIPLPKLRFPQTLRDYKALKASNRKCNVTVSSSEPFKVGCNLQE
jgi:hypothetical protein